MSVSSLDVLHPALAAVTAGGARFGAFPWLGPAVLAAVGLVALSVAAARWQQRRRALAALLAVLAAAAGGSSAWLAVERAPLFWQARFDAGSGTLVLDRAAPLPDVVLPVERVASVLEFTAPERGLRGPRIAVRYEIRTDDGRSFWSGPVFTIEARDRARRELVPANGYRLQRFRIGRDL